MSKNATSQPYFDENDEVRELDDEFFANATLHENGVPKRRPGQRGPGKRPTREAVTIRLEPDIVAHFRAGGPGWQTRINDALAKVVRDGR